MESDWEAVKQKKIEHLEKELKVFIGKLEIIRSNRISLEVIEKEINLKLTAEKKPSKTAVNLNISPDYELVVSNFESKKGSLITDTVLDLGYDKVGEKSTKERLYFTLSVMTKEKLDKYIKDAERIFEKGKEVFRQTHQDLKKWLKKEKGLSQDQKKNYEKQADKLEKDYRDKLLAAKEKKVRELNS